MLERNLRLRSNYRYRASLTPENRLTEFELLMKRSKQGSFCRKTATGYSTGYWKTFRPALSLQNVECVVAVVQWSNALVKCPCIQLCSASPYDACARDSLDSNCSAASRTAGCPVTSRKSRVCPSSSFLYSNLYTGQQTCNSYVED